MNKVSQTRDLRVLVASCLPCNLAVPILVAVLDQDLARLAAINKIMGNMSAQEAQASLSDINATMSLLGLRSKKYGADLLWFSFDPLPLGSYRGRPGTLSLFAAVGDGSVVMLSPGARQIGRADDGENQALLVRAPARQVSPQSVPAADALLQIRAILVQRLNNVDWAHSFGD